MPHYTPMSESPKADPTRLMAKAETYRSEMEETAATFQQALSFLKSSKSEAYSSKGVQERREAIGILFRYVELSGKYEAALQGYAAALETKVGKLGGPHALHRGIAEVSGRLFNDGHYASAIFEAFKAVNNRVKVCVPESDLDGTALMGYAFNPDEPRIKLTPCRTKSEKDEQRGFMFIFMGAMQGIRNPKAHDAVVQTDPQEAFE